jgi:hypothetical protein
MYANARVFARSISSRPERARPRIVTSLTVIEPFSITRERPPTGEETDWQIGRRELCPGLCPNPCLPSTNTVTYGEIQRETFRRASR